MVYSFKPISKYTYCHTNTQNFNVKFGLAKRIWMLPLSNYNDLFVSNILQVHNSCLLIYS